MQNPYGTCFSWIDQTSGVAGDAFLSAENLEQDQNLWLHCSVRGWSLTTGPTHPMHEPAFRLRPSYVRTGLHASPRRKTLLSLPFLLKFNNATAWQHEGMKLYGLQWIFKYKFSMNFKSSAGPRILRAPANSSRRPSRPHIKCYNIYGLIFVAKRKQIQWYIFNLTCLIVTEEQCKLKRPRSSL